MANKKKKSAAPPPPPQRKAPPRAKPPAGTSPRQAQKQDIAKAVKRDALRRRLITGGLVLAVLAGIGGYVVLDRRSDAQLREALTAGSCTTDTDSDPTRAAPGNHVPNPTFAVNPPAGGNHLGGSARSGTYAATRVPGDGLLVHSLEHGYVVVWHQPGLSAEQVAELEDVREANGTDVIVVERPTLTVPVAATAWGQRLLCGQLEADTLQTFVDAHVGNGPEDVERT